MTVRKENELSEILEEFNKMVTCVLEQLDTMEKILNQSLPQIDKQLLDVVNAHEQQIDRFERDIFNHIIDFIVLQQPVASDLRKIMAVNQMVSNLERIGDQCKNIVKALPRVNDIEVYCQMSGVISNMTMSCVIMVKKAISSFLNNDNEAAVWTIKNDDVIDEINHKLVKETIAKSKYPQETQELLCTFINLNNIISNLERIADHATNIAEASIFSNSGENLRHAGE